MKQNSILGGLSMVIGIAGGIACGKSTISKFLEEKGAYIIDADGIGREVVQKGEKAYNEIVRHFGSHILLNNGEINRKKLGNIVFSNPGELKVLNDITHPEIVKRISRKVDNLKKTGVKAIVIDAAILIEMGLNKYCDKIWYIQTDKETQLSRLMERDRFDSKNAQNRIKRQHRNERNISFADVIINNDKPLEKIKKEVIEIWDKTIEGKE